jgi:hypothetical protein
MFWTGLLAIVFDKFSFYVKVVQDFELFCRVSVHREPDVAVAHSASSRLDERLEELIDGITAPNLQSR